MTRFLLQLAADRGRIASRVLALRDWCWHVADPVAKRLENA